MSKRSLAALLALLSFSAVAWAQSTFGTIVGTVKDPSGATVAGAKVTITNIGTSAERTATTDSNGNYLVPNLEPTVYKVTVDASGFSPKSADKVTLGGRDNIRIDMTVDLVSVAESVNVTASAAPVINTESSTIAQSKTGGELTNLPVTLGARASGSTSPMSTLTAQPGVQTDAQGNMSVQGGQPSQLSVSVDGISSVGVRTSGPLNELFPSLDTIAEIRVNQVNNSAEFGSVSDITTISKSGTNRYHGAAFWNYQNSVMDAKNPFIATKPFKNMNDLGASMGGPVIKDKTFFFAAFEALRLPRQALVVQSVPSLAYRRGDLSAVRTPIYNPATGLPFTNNQIPVNAVSANMLNLLYPLPNFGAPSDIANNYRQNVSVPIKNNQADVRIDHNLTGSQTMFLRASFKDIDKVDSVANLATPMTNSIGTLAVPEADFGATFAHNIVLTPTTFNEVRFGFTGRNFKRDFGIDAATLANQIGITGLGPAPAGSATPDVRIQGFIQTGGTASLAQRDRTWQLLDNFTINKGSHTIKMGGDIRYLLGFSSNVFSSRRLGQFIFDQAVTGQPVAGSGSSNPYIGNAYAAFLLGIPDSTARALVNIPDLRAYATHYAFYAQDDFKATSRLTFNYGLRWEYHPMFRDKLLNVTNFIEDYRGFNNGQPVVGAVVVPNDESRNLTQPTFRTAIGNTPIFTAEEVGLPFSLRKTQKTSFSPRFGFAWRPVGDKTVVRGGIGRYMVTPLGGLVGAQWGVHGSDVGLYTQAVTGRTPLLTFPSPFLNGAATVGTQNFLQGQQIDYKDPYVYQWNFTIERQIMNNTGVRLSYNGSKGYSLSIPTDRNQVPANTIGYALAKASRPFLNWGRIQTVGNGAESRYHSATVEVNRRMSAGVQFQSSYSFSKNLSNVNGISPLNFATENGNLISDRFNPGIDIGNVAFSRRHRFLTTFTAMAPFGKGRQFMNTAPKWVDNIIGGWEIAGVTLFQSGAFLTPVVSGADSSGTGLPILCACSTRPDTVAGVDPNLSNDLRTVNAWLNAAAFVTPKNNIGRFGTAPVGGVVGPGTIGVSASLTKKFVITEGIGMMIAAQATNVINHQNWDNPNMNFATANFGRISNVQSAEGAGPRVMQLALRITF